MDDQAAALGWMVEQRSKCGTCGTFAWQWPNETVEVDAYVCEGCAQVELEVDRRREDPPYPGLKLGFFPIGGDQ